MIFLTSTVVSLCALIRAVDARVQWSDFGSDDSIGDTRIAFPDTTYPFKWEDADKDFPIRISWHFVTPNETDGVNPPYDVEFIKWDTNITSPPSSGEFDWDPQRILSDDFPNDFADMTGDEALGYAGNSGSNMPYRRNVLGISQPESNDHNIFTSLEFTLQSAIVRDALKDQRKIGEHDANKKWGIGVGVGFGVGVPLLLALVVFAVLRVARRQGRSGEILALKERNGSN